jgi:lycopene beta-cyclase
MSAPGRPGRDAADAAGAPPTAARTPPPAGPAAERRWLRSWPLPPLAAWIGSWAWAPEMTYLQFHVAFTLPWLAWLAWGAARAARAGRPVAGQLGSDRAAWTGLGLLSAVALGYTYPWDQALIRAGVWGYPPGRVLAEAGGVPVEEIAFFLIQTWCVGLTLFALGRAWGTHDRGAGGAPWWRGLGAAAALVGAGAGLLLWPTEPGRYLGLILVWSMPVVAVQWAFGGDLLWRRRRILAAAIALPTAWLWWADRLAIGWSIWWISDDLTVGWRPLGLPVEEAAFFLVASTLVAGGLLLALDPATMPRFRRLLGSVRRRPWRAWLALWVLTMVPTPLLPGLFAPLAYVSTTALAIAVLVYALRRYGARAWLLFAVSFAFGVAIEVLGERTGFPFGAYTYLAPGPALFGVPLLVPIGWFAFTLVALAVAPAGRARYLAPLALVAWDLGLDPLMVREGFWAFAQGPYFGVPWSNFFGWYVSGWVLVALLLRLEPRLAEEVGGDLRAVYVAQAFLIGLGLAFFGLPVAGAIAAAAMLAVVAVGYLGRPGASAGDVVRLGFVPITAAIAETLPWVMRRALRRGLAGIWSREEAPLPGGGAIVVANHHSWWDAFLTWAIADRHGRPPGAIMDDAQLARFPFFRRWGAVGASEPRAAARRAAAGSWVLVFPEGRVRTPGPLGPTRDGAAAIARWARVPVVPLAIRVVMRGGERPEAYLRFGTPLAAGVDAAQVRDALVALLARLDDDLAAAPDPEAPLPDYAPWWRVAVRSDERVVRWRRWWGAS